MTERLVGPLIDATPARLPERITLKGRYGWLEPLDADKHAAPLWHHAKGDDDLWDYLFSGPFAEEAAFTDYLRNSAARTDPLAYAVMTAEGDAVGFMTLMEIRPVHKVIETGSICYTKALQRTPLATEAQYLHMAYAFDVLGYRRYEWKCNNFNEPSKAAAQRFGFTYEGLFRQHMVVKGRNRDTAWFSILDSEWPAIKAGFERWLAPDNFDAKGQQKKSLAAMRENH